MEHLKASSLAKISEFCQLVCVIVVWGVYSGNLTASLAVQRIEWPFRDLQGLADADDYILLLAEGTVREDLFRVSFCELIVISTLPRVGPQDHIST